MNDSPGAILARFCCAVAFVAPIGVGILQGAVLLSNKLLARYADPDRRRRDAVPMPGLLKAGGVVLAVCVANAVAGAVVGFFVDTLLPELDPFAFRYVVAVLSLPVGFVIFPAILTPVLPTSFFRACLVTVVQYVLGAAVFGVLFGGLYGMLAAAEALGRRGA